MNWSRRAALAVGGLSLARLGAAQTAGNVRHWRQGTPWLETDNPRVVAADATNLVVLVAPHVRGVQDGTCGFVSIDKRSRAVRRILRCGLDLLPQQLADVQSDGQALFWVQGSRLMRTHIASGETRELTARGALRLALHDGRVHVLNHNNHQKLEAFDVLTGQALGFVPVPPGGTHLALDGQAAWLLTSVGPKEPSVLHRIDLVRGERAEVLRTGAGTLRFDAMADYTRPEDAAQGRISGLYLVEHDFRRVTTRLLHVRASDGHPTEWPLGAIDAGRPFYADANALYFVASTNGSLRGLDTTAGLYRLGHGHATPRLLDQDVFAPASLLADGDGLYWSDPRTVYQLPSRAWW